MVWFYLIVALCAGAMMPVQAGINAQLARWVGHPVTAALVSFTVGTVTLLAYCLVLRPSLPAWGTLAGSPWWVWVGGLLGAFFVAVAAAFAPKLGAGVFVSLTIAGQMLVSLALDHYGMIGFAARAVNGWRLLGAVLIISGVVLIRRF